METGVVLGHYQIESKLGSGGMADVYLAVDQRTQDQVALKVLPPEFSRHPENVARFNKEVRASIKLKHPHVVNVFDVGECTLAGLKYYFFAMELLPHGDLKQKIESGLSVDDALEVMLATAEALRYAHQEGIVHRDIKPENILFNANHEAVVTDLGIAKATGAGTRMTQTGMSIGTPHYMSPEQARGQPVDGRSDLYSLGVVFFEMLTGQVPYDSADTFAIGLAHINEPVPRLPNDLTSYQPIIDKLLAKQPEHRYQSAEELLLDLNIAKSSPQDLTAVYEKSNDGSYHQQHQNYSHEEAPQANTLKWVFGGVTIGLLVSIALLIMLFPNQTSVPEGGLQRPSVNASTARNNRGAEQARANVVAAAPVHGSLALRSTPEGANIRLNNQLIGVTPRTIEELARGNVEVELELDGFRTERRTYTIRSGETTTGHIRLVEEAGLLSINSEPSGARVEINGRLIDERTPITQLRLPAGEHEVFVFSGGRSARFTVTLQGGRPINRSVRLERGYFVEYQGRWERPESLYNSARADLQQARFEQALAKALAMQEQNSAYMTQAGRLRRDIARAIVRHSEALANQARIDEVDALLQLAVTADVSSTQNDIQRVRNLAREAHDREARRKLQVAEDSANRGDISLTRANLQELRQFSEPLYMQNNERVMQLAREADERSRNITARFRDNRDGTVLDRELGLVWSRCSVGQHWTGDRCRGQAGFLNWDAAQSAARGAWRLPTKDELRSLVECSSNRQGELNNRGRGGSCQGNYRRPTINQAVFPQTQESFYWTSEEGGFGSAWYQAFSDGSLNTTSRRHGNRVRLVRNP